MGPPEETSGPAGYTAEAEPAGSRGLTEPDGPEDPTNPAEPEERTEPASPEGPTQPGRDAIPAAPAETAAALRPVGDDDAPPRPLPEPPAAAQRVRRSARVPGPVASVVAAGVSGMATVGSATGWPVADRLLRGGLAALVAGAAAAAPPWAVLVLATGAAVLGWTAGLSGAAAGVAALLLAIGLALSDRLGRLPLKAAVGALSAAALLRAPGGPLGATAAATAVLAAVVTVAAVRQARPIWRERIALAAFGLVGLAGIGAILGALAGLSARPAFERSSASTARALSAARAGDAPAAAASARAAAHDLHEANVALGAWWVRPAFAVPVVGAHLRMAEQVAQTAGPAVEAAAGSVEVLRLDALQPDAGRLDLTRLAAAEPELARLSDALHVAQRGAERGRSPWLVAPLQRRLEAYDTQLASVAESSDRALLAAQTMPHLLGADRPTRWFVAVANPAESRELGGCICEYAVVVADHGAIHLERAGSVGDIKANSPGRTLDGVDLPRRFLGQRPEIFWQNVAGYPDLPTVASATRALWDQVVPGSPLDGVIYVDPHGLAALLKLTGPVKAPPPLEQLTAANAPGLLLRDQYLRYEGRNDGDRRDALHDSVGATLLALGAAPIPGPGAVGAALGPAVQGGHLLAVTFDPPGQRLFDEIGASGRLPASDGGDLASLRTTNLGEDKLDAYLRRSIAYRAAVDPDAGRVAATATVELRNEATPDLPDYVVGGRRGLPRGTSLTEVAWYSGLALEGVEVDGQPVRVRSSRERGWWTHSVTVKLAAESTVKVVFRLAGAQRATHPYRLAVAPQASAYDDSYAVEVTAARGWRAAPVAPLTPGRRADVVVPLRRR